MSDFKYKGINTEKIKEIKEIHFHPGFFPGHGMAFDHVEDSINQLKPDAMREIDQQLDKLITKYKEDTEICIICEMAKLYLQQRDVLERIIDKLETERQYKMGAILSKRLVGVHDERVYAMVDTIDWAIETIKEEMEAKNE